MWKNKRQFIEYVFIICIAVVLTGFVIRDIDSIKGFILSIFGLLTPFFIGFAIAYILNQPISKLEKHVKIKRTYLILLFYLVLILLIVILSIVAIPKIVNSGMSLADDISKWSGNVPDLISKFNLGPYEQVVMDQIGKIGEMLTNTTSTLLKNIMDFIVGVTTAVFNIVLGIIISIYMLLDKKKLAGGARKIITLLFKKEKSETLFHFLSEANVIFSHFLTGLLVQASIIGILASIGFTIMGVKYSVILGVVIAVTNIIPYFGPFIGAVPAVVTTLMYDPIKAIWVIVFILILQQIDGNIVGPKVMGNYIGLDPIWIILSITLGGGLFGLLGMLLAIPIGAMVKIVLTEYLKKREDQKEKIEKDEKK